MSWHGPVHVTVMSHFGMDEPWFQYDAGLNSGSAAWPAANRAFYFPIRNPYSSWNVARFMWINGASTTGTIDMGLYAYTTAQTGSKLTSTGAITRSGTNAIQYATASPAYTLPRGRYYLGAVLSSGTGEVLRQAPQQGATTLQLSGVLYENLGGSTLPSSMNPSGAIADNYVPFIGFSQSSSV